MRILFITHFFPPKYNAGTENYTLGLAQVLMGRGHQVQVVCAEDWHTGDRYWNGLTEDTYNGVPVQRIHLNWTHASNPNRALYDSLPVETWLDQYLSTMEPDVVHVTSTYSLGIGILRSVKRAGIPLFLTLMDFWFICPNHQLFHSDGRLCDGQKTAWECDSCLLAGSNLFQRVANAVSPGSAQSKIWETLARIPLINKQRGLRGMLLNMNERKPLLLDALSLPDVVLAHSAFLQKMFAGHTAVPVKVLRNGHDFSWQNEYNGKTESNLLRIGYLGQIQWTKGVHVLIEAFNKARLDGKVRLDIWGDSSRNVHYAKMLRGLVNNNPSIVFRGRFDHDQLAAVLAGIDILVVPSIWYENAPLVIQEAFAAKTPVITTNIGGMAEAVTHNVNGLLFQRGSSDDLSNQLQRLVNESDLLKHLQTGIPSVKTFDEEATQLEAYYREAILNKRGQFGTQASR